MRGLGNFGEVSRDERTHLRVFSGYSNQAHSIALEFISGLGLIGLLYVYWLVSRLGEVPRVKSKKYLAYVLFVMLTVNFMLDTTYFVPTMMWMWGGLLGLAQSKS